MKKRYTIFLAALAAILFSVLPSQAQTNVGWDTRFWPANEKPTRKGIGTNAVFQKDVVSTNLALAVEERYWAAKKQDTPIEEDVEGSLPRYSELGLKDIKDLTRDIIGNFLDQTRFPTPDDPTSIVINTPTSSVLQLIYWNQSNILAHCNLPTNFFDYTPARNLAGHEGFLTASNDALYGWDAMRKVLTNMVYTYTDKGFLSVTNVSTNETIVVFDDPTRRCSVPSIGIGQGSFEEKTAQDFTDFAGSDQSFSWTGYGLENGDVYFNNNSANIDFSYLSAYLYPENAPLSNGQHTAYAFTRQAGESSIPLIFGFFPESGGWPQALFSAFRSCFSNFVQVSESGFYDFVAPSWQFSTTISTVGILSDGSRVAIGPTSGAVFPSCSLCGLLDFVPTDGIDGDSNFGIIEIDDVEYTFIGRWFDRKVGEDGLFSIGSFIQAAHVIKWDFTYK